MATTKPTPNANFRFGKRQETLVAIRIDGSQWIREEAERRGWRLFNLSHCGGSIPAGLDFQGAILKRKPDDLWVERMADLDCPKVYVGHIEATTDMLQPSVTPNMFAEGQLAADHFAERSFRQLGFFAYAPWGAGRRLWEGFQARAKALGINVSLFQTKRVKGETAEEKDTRRRQEFTEWLRALPKPMGLLTSADAVAAMYCNWAALAGFEVPGDVAVLARGNAPEICETFIPSISHLDIDKKGQIELACDLLERMMAGEEVSEEPVFIKPKGVVVRESTDLLATPDKMVATVLRYMWDNLSEDLTVEDLARDLDLCPRNFGRRFKKALNRSFRQELRRKRLEEAQRLLRDTDYKLPAIAETVGFKSTSYLHRSFQRAFGMTPHAYRKQPPKSPE